MFKNLSKTVFKMFKTRFCSHFVYNFGKKSQSEICILPKMAKFFCEKQKNVKISRINIDYLVSLFYNLINHRSGVIGRSAPILRGSLSRVAKTPSDTHPLVITSRVCINCLMLLFQLRNWGRQWDNFRENFDGVCGSFPIPIIYRWKSGAVRSDKQIAVANIGVGLHR